MPAFRFLATVSEYVVESMFCMWSGKEFETRSALNLRVSIAVPRGMHCLEDRAKEIIVLTGEE